MTNYKISPASNRTDIGLLILRVATGAIFAAHGGQKLFVYGFGGVTGAFAGMGIPLPGVTGPLTAVVEFFGGLALVFGLLNRLAGFGLAITMVGAIGFVNIAGGFFAPTGVEFTLSLLGATTALAVAGAGRYSLDALIAARGNQAPQTTQFPQALGRAA